MKTRGRNSIYTVAPTTFVDGRPEPPEYLNDSQKTTWRAIVSCEDPGFFKTYVCRGLLADYCRRRSTFDELTVVIEGFGEDWRDDDDALARFDQLLRMRDRENAAMVLLATKLRLTNQSRYVPHVAATAAQKAVAAEEVPWRKSA